MLLLLLLLLLSQHLLNPELQNADQHFSSRFETLKNFEPTYFFSNLGSDFPARSHLCQKFGHQFKFANLVELVPEQ